MIFNCQVHKVNGLIDVLKDLVEFSERRRVELGKWSYLVRLLCYE